MILKLLNVATPAVCRKSVLELPDLNRHHPIAPAVQKEQYAYHLRSDGGFFKFTLSRPEYAFGHQEYPFLLGRTLTANARRKKKHQLPHPPFTPQVNSISIDYKASAVINMEKGLALHRKDTRERVNHLHPLGLERIYPPIDNQRRTVLPHYDLAGALTIGLDGSHPAGRLTLFFHIQNRTEPVTGGSEPSPRWHYLASNRWREVPPHNIVADTTNAFRRSGMVTLDIPEDIDRNSSVLHSDLFWLRISVGRRMQAMGDLYGVAAQALSATWADPGNAPDHLAAPLPAGTITAPRTAIAGIGKIVQPIATTEGIRAVSLFELEQRSYFEAARLYQT